MSNQTVEYLMDKYGLTMDVGAVERELHVTRRWLEKQKQDPDSDFPRPTRLGRAVRYITSEVVAHLERQRVTS